MAKKKADKDVAPSGARVNDPIAADQLLEETPQWKHLSDVWREAEQIGSGQRGPYPFDAKGKKKIIDDLQIALGSVKMLRGAGFLSDAEAALLKDEFATLKTRVKKMRPTEMRMRTCYKAMPPPPRRDGLTSLTKRLPLLEKLAVSETLQPRVVSRVLATVESDLAAVSNRKMLDLLTKNQKSKAEDVCRQVKSHVERIKQKLEGGSNSFQSDRRWRSVVDAWNAAAPLARSGRSTTAQRKTAEAQLEAARRHITSLTEDGLLMQAEAVLLYSEAAQLRERIYENPPSDYQVRCYSRAFMPPIRKSLQRLNQRLPLLEKLAAEGRVHPAALQKVLGSIEADIKTLSARRELKHLEANEKENAQKLRKRAEAAVAEIKKLLEESE